jgi:hypothetical protein
MELTKKNSDRLLGHRNSQSGGFAEEGQEGGQEQVKGRAQGGGGGSDTVNRNTCYEKLM